MADPTAGDGVLVAMRTYPLPIIQGDHTIGRIWRSADVDTLIQAGHTIHSRCICIDLTQHTSAFDGYNCMHCRRHGVNWPQRRVELCPVWYDMGTP